jgi:hypothetical protein
MTKKNKICILVLLATFLVFGNTFAETVVLKSGKIVDGKIIEKTDKYIKIDLYGIPVTYYMDDIESIDGEKVIKENVLFEQTVSEMEEDGIIPEIAWADISNYWNEVDLITQDLAQKTAPLIKERLSLKDSEAIKNNIISMLEQVRPILQKLKNIIPPKGLEFFHENTVSTIEFNNEIISAMSRSDINAASNIELALIIKNRSVTERFKKICQKAEAPAEFINMLDQALERSHFQEQRARARLQQSSY